MPELAEVEWFRGQWDCGRNQKIIRVAIHEMVRIFRFIDPEKIRSLRGSRLLSSEARGKQMLFQFSGGKWLGLHLGMTGRLHVAEANFTPAKHDHLVLFQARRALVFTDSRQFGAVRFDVGREQPSWWRSLAPSVLSDSFTQAYVANFLRRHARLPIKGVLLLQSGFPGVGNWMADEILWRARLNPRLLAGKLQPADMRKIWRQIRGVCRKAVDSIVEKAGEPPANWLFHVRWNRHGKCPRDGAELKRADIAGRTTAWCPKCQRARR